jgi:hypothetical protein
MSRKRIYLVAAILGAIGPYIFFIRFLAHDASVTGFLAALFVNGAAGGLTVDLLTSSAVLWIFMLAEGRRLAIRHLWIYIVLNLAIGLSCALPLFLWTRETALARPARPASS